MNDINITHESKIKLQGYAIGYEILEKGVVVRKHTYPVPVKNLVVSNGKDMFCNMSPMGQNADVFALHYCTRYLARGSGSTPAAAGNTQLEAQIGNRTNIILSGDPYTGVKYTAATGLIQARKTYDSEVETSDQNINEIGIFSDPTGVTSLFARIVLPATVTVLAGQQLRLTYELQITVAPIAETVSSPTITGWTTTGVSRLEGTLPTTTSFGSGFSTPTGGTLTNQFVPLWDNAGSVVNTNNLGGPMYLNPSAKPVLRYSNYGQATDFEWFSAKTFNTFGGKYTTVSNPVAPNNVSIDHSGSYSTTNSTSGTATVVINNYVTGTFYRDLTVTMEPNFPAGLDATNIKAIRCRGLTHIFDTPVQKLNTQRLTLVFRVSVA